MSVIDKLAHLLIHREAPTIAPWCASRLYLTIDYAIRIFVS